MSAMPRPASTVVLIDESSKLYLTKRPETMKFMGGFYVFPGGAVDKGDKADSSDSMDHSLLNDSFDPAHYIAAAREIFEEVGILICRNLDGSAILLEEEKQAEYRHKLLNRAISFHDFLKTERLRVDFENLKYFGHIITPEISPIRFDTRFFLSQLPKGQYPRPDDHEISDAFWISPIDALSEFEQGRISLAPPTLHSLKTIINYLNGSPLFMQEYNLSEYTKHFKK
ncbi:NUDIX hydrolase [Neobacillus muris]|uniref:NUDIX hydrolase n=1 Tax=Neobacillus muris TaxID=2941334 RepID=UPI00203A4050|nr:NUDIX hydrolase [Neobacillus muris]